MFYLSIKTIFSEFIKKFSIRNTRYSGCHDQLKSNETQWGGNIENLIYPVSNETQFIFSFQIGKGTTPPKRKHPN